MAAAANASVSFPQLIHILMWVTFGVAARGRSLGMSVSVRSVFHISVFA